MGSFLKWMLGLGAAAAAFIFSGKIPFVSKLGPWGWAVRAAFGLAAFLVVFFVIGALFSGDKARDFDVTQGPAKTAVEAKGTKKYINQTYKGDVTRAARKDLQSDFASGKSQAEVADIAAVYGSLPAKAQKKLAKGKKVGRKNASKVEDAKNQIAAIEAVYANQNKQAA